MSWIERSIKATARRAVGVALRGKRYRCPVCEKRYSSFLPMGGVFPSFNAMCPGCYSLERHRSLWLYLNYLQQQDRISLAGRMLHIAPEPCLTKRFRKTFDYLSVDLDGSKAMCAADITRLEFPDNYFNAVVCNHVLEHIPDDRRAMAEVFRVLRPGGWASLQVPRTEGTTDEDPRVTDSEERTRRFGQSDHVRLYGRDYFDRLREAGFEVTIQTWKDFLQPADADCYVLPVPEEMILGWKPTKQRQELETTARMDMAVERSASAVASVGF